MIILWLSDPHLGNGSRADDFGDNDERFIAWHKGINPDLTIVVGDFKDKWQFREKRINKAHKVLLAYFKTINVKYVDGNHDYKLWGKDKIIMDFNGMPTLSTHGHQGQKSMRNPFVRFGCWLLGIIERFPGREDIDNHERSKNPYIRKQHQKAVDATTAHAMTILENTEIKIVFQGHDHGIKIIILVNGKKYCNCGTCQGGTFEGILGNSDTGSLEKVSS